MKANSTSARSGFTLIELLTVIAIIGILAAIIIPTVAKVRDTAKSSICSSNIRQVGMALRLCAGDRKDLLPKPTNNLPGGLTWHQMIESYLPMRDKNSWNKGQHAVMTCPGIKWNDVTSDEAGACYSLAGAAVGLNGVSHDPGLERKLSSIVTPSLNPWLIDGAQSSPGSATGKFYAHYWLRNNTGAGAPAITTDATGNTDLAADFRHGNSVNVCMADGSVKRISRTDWTSKYPSIGPGSRRFLGLE